MACGTNSSLPDALCSRPPTHACRQVPCICHLPTQPGTNRDHAAAEQLPRLPLGCAWGGSCGMAVAHRYGAAMYLVLLSQAGGLSMAGLHPPFYHADIRVSQPLPLLNFPSCPHACSEGRAAPPALVPWCLGCSHLTARPLATCSGGEAAVHALLAGVQPGGRRAAAAHPRRAAVPAAALPAAAGRHEQCRVSDRGWVGAAVDGWMGACGDLVGGAMRSGGPWSDRGLIVDRTQQPRHVTAPCGQPSRLPPTCHSVPSSQRMHLCLRSTCAGGHWAHREGAGRDGD